MAFIIKIRLTSELSPPLFHKLTNNSSSYNVKLTNNGIIAVLIN